jgi:hypothetical protein
MPRIAMGDLAGLDALSVDSIALPLFNHVRQPLGVAGFVDWRLCGRIGRMVLKRKFKGELGETMLMSTLSRVGEVQRIFLFGLGSPREMNESEAASQAQKLVTVLTDAGCKQLGIAGPPPLLLQMVKAAKSAAFEELFLLDPDGTLPGILGPL